MAELSTVENITRLKNAAAFFRTQRHFLLGSTENLTSAFSVNAPLQRLRLQKILAEVIFSPVLKDGSFTGWANYTGNYKNFFV